MPLTDEELAEWWRVVSDNPNHVVHRLIDDLRASRRDLLALGERLVAEGHWSEDHFEEWKEERGLK